MNTSKDFALVVDSTTILPSWVHDLVRVESVPLHINLEGEEKREPEWTVAQIAKAVSEGRKVTSACPSPADFSKAYEKLFEEGYQNLLVLPLDKAISHTTESALMARDALEDDKKARVVIEELLEANYGLSLLVQVLAQYVEKGYSFSQLVEKTREIKGNFHLCWTLSTLEPLYKGGRLSRFSFIVGSFLKIKPIIGVNPETGELRAEKKVRTFNDVDRYFLEVIAEAMDRYEHVYMSFVRMGNEELTEGLIKKALEAYPDLDYTRFDGVGPLFTVHLGDSGYGIGYIGEGKKRPDVEKKSIIDKILKR